MTDKERIRELEAQVAELKGESTALLQSCGEWKIRCEKAEADNARLKKAAENLIFEMGPTWSCHIRVQALQKALGE